MALGPAASNTGGEATECDLESVCGCGLAMEMVGRQDELGAPNS